MFWWLSPTATRLWAAHGWSCSQGRAPGWAASPRRFLCQMHSAPCTIGLWGGGGQPYWESRRCSVGVFYQCSNKHPWRSDPIHPAGCALSPSTHPQRPSPTPEGIPSYLYPKTGLWWQRAALPHSYTLTVPSKWPGELLRSLTAEPRPSLIAPD